MVATGLKAVRSCVDASGVTTCPACGCPADPARDACAWCAAELDQNAPVTFVLERAGEHYEWSTNGTVVAAATPVHGLWQIVDARGQHVVTLMPLSPASEGEGRSLALVGPTARVLGTIDAQADEYQAADVTARDDDGRPMLVLRADGATASHMVDRHGEVVAVSSWGERDGVTDLLVTSSGTRQPLAMVFGLVLATELHRNAGRHLA